MSPITATVFVAILVLLAHVDAAPLPSTKIVGADRLRLSVVSRAKVRSTNGLHISSRAASGATGLGRLIRAAVDAANNLHFSARATKDVRTRSSLRAVSSRLFSEDHCFFDPDFCDEYFPEYNFPGEVPLVDEASNAEQRDSAASAEKSVVKSATAPKRNPEAKPCPVNRVKPFTGFGQLTRTAC